jgi:hypothetical protein
MSAENSTQNNVQEMFNQAAQLLRNAFETSIKMQEQSTRSLTEMIGGLSSPGQWQEKGEAAMKQMLQTTEENMNDTIQLITNNTRTGVELLEKAFSAQPSLPAGFDEPRLREVWETAIGSFMRNAEVAVQANNRMVESLRTMTQAFGNGAGAQAEEKG